MANTNSLLNCNLTDEEGFDEYAHLDTLRMVIEHMSDKELVKILKDHRPAVTGIGRWKSMLNAFYAGKVRRFARWHRCGAIWRVNPTLMRICGFRLETDKKLDTGAVEESVFALLEFAGIGGRRTWCDQCVILLPSLAVDAGVSGFQEKPGV